MISELESNGKILFLTKNDHFIRQQLNGSFTGNSVDLFHEALLDDISTDEITPGWCCLRYDETLGKHAYIGLRGGVVSEGDCKRFSPQIVVGGYSFGCGSSREHAVYANVHCGVKVIFAKSFSRIFQQNCHNVGILTSSDFGLLKRILFRDHVPVEELCHNVDSLERDILESGGLLDYLACYRESNKDAAIDKEYGKSSIVDKIISSKLSGPEKNYKNCVGEAQLLHVDVRFSHDYVTPMIAEICQRYNSGRVEVVNPRSCYFFDDHLSLSGDVFKNRKNGDDLISSVEHLSDRQMEVAELTSVNMIGRSSNGGSRSICHNYILEHVALPGQVIVGTDSHTCTAGAVGALAFGVGATDMAGAWRSEMVQLRIPDIINIQLTGAIPQFCSTKDVVLRLMSHPIVREHRESGYILYFSGNGCKNIGIDERATLCNMAVELGAITGIFNVDEVTKQYLIEHRGEFISDEWLGREHSIGNFIDVVHMDLSVLNPMISYPGDPKNVREISLAENDIIFSKAYGGSCTGGKCADMDMYAEVFTEACKLGIRPAGVSENYIQVGSESVKKYVIDKKYDQLFKLFHVTLLPPSCGACINAGPGVSTCASEVTISAQNRNFPGRSGPGKVFLASPYTVAASMVAGYITSASALFGGSNEN